MVKQANAPFIVVEVKLSKTFENIDNEKLKYDPSVRQVQMYAMSLGAPYYVVTNGNDFLWFDISEDGRPRKIQPVFYKSGNSDNVLGATIGEALNICRELLKSDSMTSDFMFELILILLWKGNIFLDNNLKERLPILNRNFVHKCSVNSFVVKPVNIC